MTYTALFKVTQLLLDRLLELEQRIGQDLLANSLLGLGLRLGSDDLAVGGGHGSLGTVGRRTLHY